MALIPHAYPPCHDCQCVFHCVLFSFTGCLNSRRGIRKPESEGGAFSRSQRNVDLSTEYPTSNSFDVRLFPPLQPPSMLRVLALQL